jgi:hypothetical protein
VTYLGPTQLGPGERAEVLVQFVPAAAGWAESTVEVTLGGGAQVTLHVDGAGRPPPVYGPHLPGEEPGAAEAGGFVVPPEPEPKPEPLPDPHQQRLDERAQQQACATDEQALHEVRTRGERAADQWRAAATSLINHYHNETIMELNLYLMRTSSSPGLSSLSMPDPSFLRGFFQNAFGDVVGEAAKANYQRGARRQVARRGAGAARAARTARTAGATAGSVGGLPGRAIGFLAVVLIENMAEMLYHGLVGSSDRALREAYGQGHTQGARDHGARLMEAMEELGLARDAALRQLADDHAVLSSLLRVSCDPDELERLVAHAEGLHQQAVEAVRLRPRELGLARELLARWVLDNAATPTTSVAEVERSQWHAAVKDLGNDGYGREDRIRDKGNERLYDAARGTLRNRPDLFIQQCVRQWHAAGLPIEYYEGVMSRFVEELAAAGDSRLGGALRDRAEPEKADALAATRIARAARERFHLRPFVWSGYPYWDGPQKRFDNAKTGAGNVSCAPVLEVAEGCCYVKEWRWLVRTPTSHMQRTSVPGQQGWRGGRSIR